MPSDPQPLGSSEPSPPSDSDPNGKGSSRSTTQQAIRENVITIALALLLAVGLRTFVAEARWIPSDSMLPTLAEGDRLVVEKITYRLAAPQRGDIVVFNPPASLHFDGAYIKRVIGLPGDRVRVQQGVGVYINDVLLPEPYVQAPADYNLKTLGEIGLICGLTSPFSSDQARAAIVVPPNSYFMMGDNRNNSQDSHCWGFLPKANVIGRTMFRWWPVNRLLNFPPFVYPVSIPPAPPPTP